MKKIFIIATGLILILSNCDSQNPLKFYFEYANKHYPELKDIEWRINYDNSFNISNELIETEAIGCKSDTTYFITFAFFPNDSQIDYSLLEFATIYSIQDTLYYTSFDSVFTPIYRYKYTEENPDSLFFEFGKELYK